MKLNVKGFALASGIIWAIAMAWILALAMMGKGAVVFECVNQFYIGLLSPSASGFI